MKTGIVSFVATILALPIVAIGETAPVVSTSEASTETVPVLATFEANYEVHHGRTHVGDSVMTLTRRDDGFFEYRNRAEARGLARWLVKDKVVHGMSRFEISDGQPRPVSYTSDGPKKNDNESITFNYDLDQAFSNYKGQQVVIDLTPGTLDLLSMDIALMMCMTEKRELSSVDIIYRNEARRYLYEVEGAESIKTDAGQFETIKVRRQREGSTRHYQLWLAPSLGYLPVQVQQFRKGKLNNTLTLIGHTASSQAP